MNIIDIIIKKKNKEELTEEEIQYVVNSFVSGEIKDYQMSSLLMAIVINGMTDNEVIFLTKYMMLSGSILDLSNLSNVVDKHSTGGVGDKTTLIISPIVASLDCKVAKMSGRGLGYTGGTIDKLESIPGFNVNLTKEEFIKEIEDIGMAITSQTSDIALADKKIYALRDVTGTTESIPLIASSIMSKKIASGSKNLVLDIKVGEGALIKNIEDARHLANLMIKIGKENNMKVICLLTNMNIPLGNNIGNSLEVLEALNTLYYVPNNNLTNLCIELASYMVELGLNISYEESKQKVLEVLNNKKAYNKLLEFVKYQNGDITKLPKSSNIYEVKSEKEGYLTNLHSLEIAKLSSNLGSGRKTKEDKIDYSAGIIINKNINDKINIGDTILTLYTNKELPQIDKDKLFVVSSMPNKNVKLIYEVIK
ncbi:MAG: thymidine phosphorylase [Firmicutes bacterium]|nr:thymidine phosphorylase [Bacillota bacterium]MDY5335745.1 thymidine phosphorylase [Bacilli bacterium]